MNLAKKSPKPEFSREHAALKKRFELFVVPIWGIILCFFVSNRLHVNPKIQVDMFKKSPQNLSVYEGRQH